MRPASRFMLFLLIFSFIYYVLRYEPKSPMYIERLELIDNSEDVRPLLFMGILSGEQHRERRDALRNTWIKTMLRMRNDLPFQIQYKFFLDKRTKANDEENQLYKDIEYLNVPEQGYAVKFGRKMYNLIRYIHQKHPTVTLAMRVDDDVFLCVPQIFDRLYKLMSPTLYYGWRHGTQDTFSNPSFRIDEMLLVLGKTLIDRVANRTYCDSSKCDMNTLQDTNYGGTSLRNWLAVYNDVNFHGDNHKIFNKKINKNTNNWMKYVTLHFCESNVALHTVKISAFMKVMHENNEKLKAIKA